MSTLLEGLMKQLGGGALQQISGALGTDEKTAGTAVAAALPTLLGALSRNASSPQGAEALSSALQKDHDGGILDDLSGFLGRSEQGPGAGILKHVLGNKQPAVERSLSRSTGMDAGSTGKLLAMLAPIVMGSLGKTSRQQGLNVSGLASMLGSERKSLEGAAPKGMGALGMLLDSDGDGDVDLGDVAKKGLGLLGGLLGKR